MPRNDQSKILQWNKAMQYTAHGQIHWKLVMGPTNIALENAIKYILRTIP